MPNTESAGLGELDHAISIYQFPMFHGPFAAEYTDVSAKFVEPTDRRVWGRQHNLTARF